MLSEDEQLLAAVFLESLGADNVEQLGEFTFGSPCLDLLREAEYRAKGIPLSVKLGDGVGQPLVECLLLQLPSRLLVEIFDFVDIPALKETLLEARLRSQVGGRVGKCSVYSIEPSFESPSDRPRARGDSPLHGGQGEACGRPSGIASDISQLPSDEVGDRIVEAEFIAVDFVLYPLRVTILEQLVPSHVAHDLLRDLTKQLRWHIELVGTAVAPGVRVKQPEQSPHTRILTGMRRGGHQYQSMAPPRHYFGRLVALAAALDEPVGTNREREAVSLVDDSEVPLLLGSLQCLPGPSGPKEVSTDDDAVVGVPRVLGERCIEM